MNTQAQPRSKYSPSTEAVFTAFVALLILLLWLQFILAQGIETLGREIDVRTQELDRIERQNQAILNEIAGYEVQNTMSSRAWEAGYRPQQPLYLGINRPLAQDAGPAQRPGSLLPWAIVPSASETAGDDGQGQTDTPAQP